ncbi:reverse transcriptase [Lasius niger]|uniref:Reverse transcriptase n=1 Tax=Lasius niger TaxID=67767 RepID=A0A0J7NBH8_LASNI|nr:reverse transcriptase [Lasius niger]
MDNIEQPPREVMEPTAVMTSSNDVTPQTDRTPIVEGLWAPIMEADLRLTRIARSSAAGPDGISARLFRATPGQILLRIYILLRCRELLEDLLRSRTIFIPKKQDANDPEDFRPITIPPVLVRSLHKILAKRMEVLLDIDPRQRAFKSTDGWADNIFLVDTLLRLYRREFRPLNLASLHVGKAFDFITHSAVETTLTSLEIPSP